MSAKRAPHRNAITLHEHADDEIVSAPQLAEILSCTAEQIPESISAHEIPAPFMLQGNMMWFIGDVKAYFKRRATQSQGKTDAQDQQHTAGKKATRPHRRRKGGKQRHRITGDIEATVLEMQEHGFGVKEIAAKMELPYPTVYQYLKRKGLRTTATAAPAAKTARTKKTTSAKRKGKAKAKS